MAIVVTSEDNGNLESAVDNDIREFDDYFQKGLGNSRLAPSERAIIKTFLHYHLVAKAK